MEWLRIILSNMATIVTIVLLAVNLVKYVQKAVREENWGEVLSMVMRYMDKAEQKFSNGADRKEWVLAMVEASASTINFNIDMDKISQLIDDLCNMSRTVNALAETGEAGE